MRVTQGMMNSQFLTNLMSTNKNLMNYQNQLASGKKLNKPSDDPVGVGYAMRYRSQIARNDQYMKNVDLAKGYLDFNDTILSQVQDVLGRAKDLAVQTSSGTMSADDRKSAAAEVDQLYQQLVQIGNTQYNDHYIFNGQTTDVRPYDAANAMSAKTDDGSINYIIGEGATAQVNFTGNQVFGDPAAPADTTTTNVFAVVQNLRNALNADDQASIQGLMGKLDSRMSSIRQIQGEVGGRTNRVDMMENRLKDFDTNLQGLLGNTEDADIEQTVTQLKMAEAVQNASLATGARVLLPTLTDFLK